MKQLVDKFSDRITHWVGSTTSLVLHTLFFGLAFAAHWLFAWPFDLILLVLTTIVSLEAIYLALFIQRSVNQQALRLHYVEENLDDIEESIDEVERNLDEVEEAIDDVEESLTETEGDIADIPTDTVKKLEQPLDEVVDEIKQLLDELKKNLDKKVKK